MADWRVVMDYPAIDEFLHGPVMVDIALATGPRIAAGARAMAPIGRTSPRPGRLKASIEWSLDDDALGQNIKISGRIWDMDLEAPAEQLHHHYGGLVSSLRANLPRVILID